MFARIHTGSQPELELLKWIALVILAGAIALMLAAPVRGQAGAAAVDSATSTVVMYR